MNTGVKDHVCLGASEFGIFRIGVAIVIEETVGGLTNLKQYIPPTANLCPSLLHFVDYSF